MADYTPQTGLDDDTTRQWHELTHTRARRPLGALRTFWSEHVSTSDGTQFTVTHVELARPTCTICHAAEATVYARPNAEPTLCYSCAFIAREAVADDTPTDAPGEDCPEHGPYGDDDCPKCGCGAPATTLVHCRGTHRLCDECYQREFEDNYEEFRGWESEPIARAVTLQSIEIEGRIFVCKNCQGIHPTQKCPELRAALLADEPAIAVYETREMIRLWGASRTLLVAKLARLTRPQLVCQAVAFAAWLETRTQAGLSAASVLHIWETMLDGPAAPAIQAAA